MQFTLLASLATLATLAAATIPASQCTTGPIECCDSVQPASSDAVSKVLATIGVVLQDVNVDVGLTCSPVSVIGVGGNSCSASPVCCEDKTFAPLAAINCVPVDLSL
ncbi:fungal hydrophobin [Dendrothele bispora CBS 962.96]|uniref:Hydrophobin n=1 Tax=Dendrothele bispora (strain CBS 962.96) TaxID=1314807 RepID=A0A4V4HEB6_DENBC|nr:fungal hydrophobin [Dendrothele bispora CBS 962.96]